MRHSGYIEVVFFSDFFFPTSTEKIIAVNGQIFSPDVLKDAIKNSKSSKEPIHFILQADNYIQHADIDYHNGERYPSLQRVEGTPDLLDEITAPLVKTDDTKPLFNHHEGDEGPDMEE